MNWKNKKVLVTGAGGFIGSHLSEKLVQDGAKVRSFVHYNALGSCGWLDESPFKKEMEVIAGDITDRDSVRHAMQGCETVFHLAALIAIPYSYRSPASFIRTNIEGTLNIISNARELDLERVVHTSTSEVYGTALYTPIDEKHPLQGQSPYSASKIGADKIAEAFHLSFDAPIVTVRPFNTFGPRQSARAIIPTIISQGLNNKVIRLGNLTPTRDLNFVSNTVNGFMLAGATPDITGQVINIGSGSEISMGDLAQLIIDEIDKNVQIEIDFDRVRPGGSEVKQLLADNTLAKKLLGWEPKIDLRTGIKITIEWLRNNIQKFNTDIYNI